MYNAATGLWSQPSGSMNRYRLLAIDPGTSMLGISVLECDFATQAITLIYATTIDADRACRTYALTQSIHGYRFARLHALKESLLYIMQDFGIHGVVSECPYMGRFPQAFAALTECLSSIRMAVQLYDELLPLHEIDPATVKMNVNVSGKSGDKELMRRAVSELVASGRICNYGSVAVLQLDEHAIDAMAVGYAHLRMLLQ